SGGRVEQEYLRQIEERLQGEAVLLESALRGASSDAEPLWKRLVAPTEPPNERITLIDDKGRVLADSWREAEGMDNHADRPEVLAARQHRLGTATRWSTSVHQGLMYLALRTQGDTGAVAFVRVALPLGTVQGQVSAIGPVIW